MHSSERLLAGLAGQTDTPSFTVIEYVHAPSHSVPEHRHSNPAAVLSLDGGFAFDYRRRHTFDCKRGSLLIVPPEENHSETIRPEGAHSLIIYPTDDWGPEVGIDRAMFEDRAIVRDADTSFAASWLQDEMQAPDDLTPLTLETLLLDLLHRIGCREKPTHGAPSWLSRVKQCLDDEYAKGHTLARLASEVGVSRSLLAREFKTAFGTTVGGYLRCGRLIRAAEALATSPRPVSEVAVSCGFYDQSHFTAAFRRHFGITPGAYRRRRGSNVCERTSPLDAFPIKVS